MACSENSRSHQGRLRSKAEAIKLVGMLRIERNDTAQQQGYMCIYIHYELPA